MGYRDNIRKDMTFNINKLRNDINILKNQYEEEEKALNDHEINTKKQQTDDHGKNVKDLNIEIEKTTAKLMETKAVNFDLKLEIKKKVKRIENEIEEIKNKYNADMINISIESEKLLKLNESETKRLHELQAKIEEFEKIREEHESFLESQRAKDAELKQICERAAINIQKIWRGHSVRKGLKKKERSKKG